MLGVTMVMQTFAPALGGAERQVEQLAPLLAERGVAVSVVTRSLPGAPPRERRHGADVLRVRVPAAPAAASATFTAAGAWATARMRPDVIHVHDLLSPATIGLLAGPARGVPVVAKMLSSGEHGDVARLLTKPLGRARLRAMCRTFARFVCVSAEIETELRDQGVPPERLVRLPNGVDVGRFRPPRRGEREAARAAFGLPRDATLALYCGRFRSTKRLDRVVGAMARSRGHLVLAGEGPERARLEAQARALGAQRRVHLLDPVPDPAPLLRAADVYVTASAQDGLSNAVLEAMASGLPVVAARAGGMAELVDDSTGVLVDGARAEEIGAAIAALAANAPRRAQLGARARLRVCARFSLVATADRLAALYRELAPAA